MDRRSNCDLEVVQIVSEYFTYSLNAIRVFFQAYMSEVSIFIFEFGAPNMILFSIFSSLYVFGIIFFYGSYIGDKGSSIFSISMTCFSFLNLSVYIYLSFKEFWFIYFNKVVYGVGDPYKELYDIPVSYFTFGSWIQCFGFDVSWGFLIDPLALVMMWVILFITLMVQIYCLDYMYGDPFFSKFYSYLSIFAFFMLFLVSSSNYLQIFLGWEGVGLASFMLISFWSGRKDAVLAGMKAMFMNRFGDLFFIVVLVVFLKRFQTLDFTLIQFILQDSNLYVIDFEFVVVLMSLIFASMAKSAQFGLHMWLPDAMEGPTPVSALIHAATMVTAGIFVLIRSSYILVLVPSALNVMILVGGLTALFGSSVACVQFDIKKVVAYSTCSQLGYMMMSCGSGNFIGAFFHLVNHAFFKALLFLGSGSVIHAMSNEQDMRKMGSLSSFLPFTYIIMVFGSAALAGFPFFSGFYSKDYILEFTYSINCITSYLGFALGSVSAFFTAFYSFRLIYLVFYGKYNGGRINALGIHEPPFFMTFALSILVIPSVAFGFFFRDLFLSDFGIVMWSMCISTVEVDFFVLPVVIKQFPTFLSFFGVLVGYIVYVYKPLVFHSFFFNQYFQIFYRFLIRKWYFDELMWIAMRDVMYVGFEKYWLYFEKGFLVYFGPAGLSYIFGEISKFFNFFGNKKSLIFIYLKFVGYFVFGLIISVLSVPDFFNVNIYSYFPFIVVVQFCFFIYYLFKLNV